MAEKHYRSLAKAVSWRLTGSLDTLIITFLVTGNAQHLCKNLSAVKH
jgi:hypothetical protein